MSAGFTPGPWEQMPGGVMGSLTVWNERRALVVATAGGADAYEALANARLIAAAPKLLEALSDALDIFNPEPGEEHLAPKWAARAKAAVAAATGEAP